MIPGSGRSLGGGNDNPLHYSHWDNLIDRVPDELWNGVRDIVQETGIKTIPMEKKCKNQFPFSSVQSLSCVQLFVTP